MVSSRPGLKHKYTGTEGSTICDTFILSIQKGFGSQMIYGNFVQPIRSYFADRTIPVKIVKYHDRHGFQGKEKFVKQMDKLKFQRLLHALRPVHVDLFVSRLC